MEDNSTLFWVKVITAVAAGIAAIITAVLKFKGGNNSVNQTGNKAGGDIAGRDINK